MVVNSVPKNRDEELVSIYLLQIFNICYQFGKLVLRDLSRWADSHIKATYGNLMMRERHQCLFLAVLGP